MDDLLGFGKGSDKLIAAVERAIGAVYRPIGVRLDAGAEAYRLRKIEETKTDLKARSTVELAKAKVDADLILAEGKRDVEERLEKRLKHKAIQQQLNIDKIVQGAVNQPQPKTNTQDVDPDWLDNFFGHAQGVSGREMQALWSRVLALEVGIPGSFSPTSLEVLRKMTRQEAESFNALCQLACSRQPDEGRKTIIYGSSINSLFSFAEPQVIELGKFGLPLLDQMELVRIGVLYGEELSWGDFSKGQEVSLKFASTELKLRTKRGGFSFKNYVLTPVGVELSALLAEEENADYIAALKSSMSKHCHLDGR